MEALGRLFDVYPVADDVYINLKNCGGVTFVGVLTTGDTWTLTEAKTSSGGTSQTLATITRWHSRVTVSDPWVLNTLAANSAFTSTASQDVVCVEVEAAELSADYKYVKLASTSTGIVIAI